MSWQDTVLAAGQVVFILALLPALAARSKPPRSTCGITGVTLLACCAALGSLELWWSCLTMAGTATCWLVLLFQRRET